jgi:recombination protein RecT
MSDAQKKPAPPSKAVTKRLAECKNLREAFQTQELRDLIAETIPKHLQPDIMLRTFIQAAGRDEKLYECDLRQSVGAFMTLAYLGLPPGPQLGLAHLIPYARHNRKREITGYDLNIIIGYQGYVELAFRSGFVRDIQTGIVLPGEVFEHQKGSDKYIKHIQNIDLDASQLTPRAAYCIVKLGTDKATGEEFEIMPWQEVLGIGDRSRAYQTAKFYRDEAAKKGARPPASWFDTPWVRDEREMGRKTVLRRAMKIVPRCPELRVAMGLEDATDKGKGMNFAPIIDGTATPMDIQEMPSEDTDQDIGGAFADRRPNDEAPEPEMPKAPIEPIHPTTTTDPTDPNPAFEAYLLDEVGDFDPTSFTDPVAWAEGFIDLWRHARDHATLVENNEDALEAAKAIPAAAEVLAIMLQPPAPPKPVAVALRNRTTGRPDWADYINSFSHVLNNWPHDLAPWLDAQRETMEKAPLPSRLLLVKAVRARGDQLHAGLPDWVIGLAAPPKAPPPTDSTPTRGGLHLAPDPRAQDAIWVEGMIHALRNVQTMDQWRDLGRDGTTQVIMTRLRRESPELFAKLDNAFVARRNELGPPNDDPPPAAA